MNSPVFAQAVVRSVPVNPAAPYAVPLVPKASLLQNLTLSAAALMPSFQAPKVADISLPTPMTAIVSEVAVVPGIQNAPVQAVSFPTQQQAHMPADGAQAALPVSAKSLQQTGQEEAKQTDPREASESEHESSAVLFDGASLQGRSQPGTSVDAVVSAEEKTAYLAQTANLSGQALLDSLHRLSGQGHHDRGYDEGRQYMYAVADNVQLNGQTGILDAYSGLFLPGKGGDGGRYQEKGDQNGDGYGGRDEVNAEHVWPQSFFNRAAPMRSDLHHLMATLSHPNSIRSNLPFGEVGKDHPEYSNKGGARMDAGVFEPPDFSKGRVARAALYFYTRYYDRNIFQGAGRHFWTESEIQTLLRWNREFPPTEYEKRRNDLVEKWQGNRNPFIDNPALADRVGIQPLRGNGGVRYGANDRRKTPEGRSFESMRSRPMQPQPSEGISDQRDSRPSGDLGRKHSKGWWKRHRGYGHQGR
ncbi:MAG: endonuclease [Elusimicrobia bacterium]|nr:endonuclease [Elusimicrobiota bacterium]